MRRTELVLTLAGACLALVLGGCTTSPRVFPPVRGIGVIAEELVTVGGGGGGADVPFSAKAGKRILIMMQSQSLSMQPYGYLTSPDGEGTYTPENERAAHGENSSEVTLSQDGDYTLTVFDGANEGGEVHVRIELLE